MECWAELYSVIMIHILSAWWKTQIMTRPTRTITTCERFQKLLKYMKRSGLLSKWYFKMVILSNCHSKLFRAKHTILILTLSFGTNCLILKKRKNNLSWLFCWNKIMDWNRKLGEKINTRFPFVHRNIWFYYDFWLRLYS